MSDAKLNQNVNAGMMPVEKSKIRDNRKIFIEQTVKNKTKYLYEDNFVKTSKYTVYDFVPKSLLFQFQRYANVYFLLIAVLQSIGIISPLSPVTAILPFILVLMVSMVREGFEDYGRHVSDELENMEKVFKLKKGEFVEDLAKNLEVGEIIKVEEYKIIPADFLLLSCDNKNKTAYIETANLDGEKNLKPKFCLPDLFRFFKDGNEKIRIRGSLICDKPNSDLNKFNGRLRINKALDIGINVKQFLYKGKVILI